MLGKFCSMSHGQPLTGSRSAAMISIRREMSLEGCIVLLGLIAGREDFCRRRGATECPSAAWETPSRKSHKDDYGTSQYVLMRRNAGIHGFDALPGSPSLRQPAQSIGNSNTMPSNAGSTFSGVSARTVA